VKPVPVAVGPVSAVMKPALVTGKPAGTPELSALTAKSSVAETASSTSDAGVSLAPATQAGAQDAQSTAGSVAARIGDWPAFVASLKLSGIVQQLAAQTELKEVSESDLVLNVSESMRHLLDKAYTDKLKLAVEQALGRRIRMTVAASASANDTLASKERQAKAEAQSRTEAAFNADPFVQDVLARFDAKVRPESIKPVNG